jgi:hypothetical protein
MNTTRWQQAPLRARVMRAAARITFVSVVLASVLYISSTPSFAITIHPGDIITPQFNNDGTILVVDYSTGNRQTLSEWPSIGAGPRMRRPTSIARFSDGDFLVSEAFTTHGIYRIDAETGDRTFISGVGSGSSGEPATRGTGPIDHVNSVQLTSTGEIILVNQAGGLMSGGGFITRVDPVTGNRTLISGQGTGSGPVFQSLHGAGLDSDGHLIVADYSQRAVFEVDLATGARSILSDATHGTGPVFGQVRDLVILPAGDIVAIAESSTSQFNYSLFQIDPTTGNRSVLLANSPDYQALSVGVDGWILGHPVDSIFYVNPNNGNNYLISGADQTGHALFWGDMLQIPVPEPSTLVLSFVGLLCAVVWRCRRAQ